MPIRSPPKEKKKKGLLITSVYVMKKYMIFDAVRHPLSHLARLGDTVSARNDDSMSHRRLFVGSKELATVSRHMLEVTNEGVGLA